MKILVRRFRDSSDGCVHSIYRNSETGDYTDVNEDYGYSEGISDSCRYVKGAIRY